MNEHAKLANANTVSVAEAKAHFSELLARAANGETIHITKHGKPYVSLEAEQGQKQFLPRVGAFKHVRLWMADDFDELGPEWDEYVK
ncbi:MAG: type II toxin-antitoxin system prevent-host-death family antitoxin [Rhizobiaceae bacterium]